MQIHEDMLWPAGRHVELIAEARRLHEAANAVRQARRGSEVGAVSAVAGRLGAPAHRLRITGSPPDRRSAWRTAARRMGRSLVTAGRRLERFGGAVD